MKGLCDSVERLPSDESRDLRPRFLGLLEEVTQLSENLHAGLGELAQLLSAASERRKALDAYSTPKTDKP